MTTHIIKQDDVLIACVKAPLNDADVRDLHDSLIAKVTESDVRGLIIDVAGLDVIDFFAARTLLDIARTIRRQGARTVIVGIQSDVSFAMDQLGVTLEDVPLARNIDEGLAWLN